MYQCTICGSQAQQHMCGGTPTLPAEVPYLGDALKYKKLYEDTLSQLGEARLALEIAKPSTIHVLSGHIYGTDGRLVEFVDGCARCRIENILAVSEKPRCEHDWELIKSHGPWPETNRCKRCGDTE